MNGLVHLVKDWEEAARQARYSAAQFAKVLGISDRHARRIMHARFGKSTHAFLEELRLKDGLSMLSRGELVKSVAQQLGYVEPANFSRAFKHKYGSSPIQYLKKLQGGEGNHVQK